MIKTNLKIRFKKPEDPALPFQDPVEIFCPQKLKGYFLRGQVVELSDNIYDKSLPEGYGYAVYHFGIFALVNDAYFKNVEPDAEDASYSALGIFSGKTKAEFSKMARDAERKNTPIEIAIKDIAPQETPYLSNSIRNGKEAIVVKFDINLDRVTNPKNNKLISNYPKRIYQLPAYHLAAKSEYREDDTARFFEDLFNILYFNFDYNFTDKREYHRLLNEIADLGYEWIENKSVPKQYIEKLNKFYSTIKDRSLPFYDFCYKFFDDLLDELKDKQKITQCSFCGNIFPFHKSRKYCTLQTEGKDCGKPARNRRFYIRHREEILPKARKTTRGLRALYRQKGIKK